MRSRAQLSAGDLEAVLARARKGAEPSEEEVLALLSLEDLASIERVMETAREVRRQRFGARVFLYGFIYLSTYCRNHCSFCFYRETNPLSPRYRKSGPEIVEIAGRLAGSGVHLIDLTLGEDPYFQSAEGLEVLLGCIAEIRRGLGVPVMVSPGVVSAPVLRTMADLGADWFALYQETHTPGLFRELRLGQSFEDRAKARRTARRSGLLVEDGILLGVGETAEDRAVSVEAMRQGRVDQARVMGFVPQASTPMAGRPSPQPWLELLCIAVLRLAMPDRLIPASLDVEGLKGLQGRLDAGANVVTSIIPSRSRLAGVSQSSLDIEQGLRTVEAVRGVLRGVGLTAASREEYLAWVMARKAAHRSEEGGFDEDRHRRWPAPRFGGCVPGAPCRADDSAG